MRTMLITRTEAKEKLAYWISEAKRFNLPTGVPTEAPHLIEVDYATVVHNGLRDWRRLLKGESFMSIGDDCAIRLEP